ncbi:hypothetical protein OG742_43510 [Streptomyces sp. NBC_00828]|uniref:hypothetical protein n=1 Tax=Streptomyces sp. NBC_00828 TaxID=2903678 RepID=UPI00386509F9
MPQRRMSAIAEPAGRVSWAHVDGTVSRVGRSALDRSSGQAQAEEAGAVWSDPARASSEQE